MKKLTSGDPEAEMSLNFDAIPDFLEDETALKNLAKCMVEVSYGTVWKLFSGREKNNMKATIGTANLVCCTFIYLWLKGERTIEGMPDPDKLTEDDTEAIMRNFNYLTELFFRKIGRLGSKKIMELSKEK